MLWISRGYFPQLTTLLATVYPHVWVLSLRLPWKWCFENTSSHQIEHMAPNCLPLGLCWAEFETLPCNSFAAISCITSCKYICDMQSCACWYLLNVYQNILNELLLNVAWKIHSLCFSTSRNICHNSMRLPSLNIFLDLYIKFDSCILNFNVVGILPNWALPSPTNSDSDTSFVNIFL